MTKEIISQYVEFIRAARNEAAIETLQERIIRNYGEIPEVLKIVISNQFALIKN